MKALLLSFLVFSCASAYEVPKPSLHHRRTFLSTGAAIATSALTSYDSVADAAEDKSVSNYIRQVFGSPRNL